MDRTREPGPLTVAAPQPLPRAFWALPILVLAAWFPVDSYWASDYFFALHWAKDFGNVLRDFTGAWYGAEDLFFFYRPLITLSLWVELQVAGANPFLAHFDNAIAHAGSAMLVGCLWRRWLSDGYAFAAGLVWGLSPMHIGAVAWAIARTDGFSCLFALSSALLFCRWIEGASRRAASLVAFALALCCKETVLPVPALLALLAFVQSPRDGLTARARFAAKASWPHFALLAAYLAWRLACLGRMGGYDAAEYHALPMALGLADYAGGLVNPLSWVPLLSDGRLLPLPAWAIATIGFVPAALGVAFCLGRARFGALLGSISWFLCASVPMASFFAQSDNHHNLRYFCLAFVGLAGLVAAGGRVAVAIALASACAGLFVVRIEQAGADKQSRDMHEQLLRMQEDGAPFPWFVAGLPHQSPNGVALQLHFGIDRLLEPPFGAGDGKGGGKVFAHRPTFALPGAVDLVDLDGVPVVPPLGTTLMFAGSDILSTVQAREIAELPLQCPEVVDCTSPALYRLNDKTARVQIATPGIRTQAMRLTFFTASGYLGALVPNHAPEGSPDGLVDLLTFFQQAQWKPGNELIRGLEPSSIMDLDPSFPVLIEGGTFDPATGAFTPTHRARRMVTFRFDRGLPKVMRGGK